MSLTDDDKRWITERLERVETTLLTEFHKWASPALDMEMEALSDRVQKLEGGGAKP